MFSYEIRELSKTLEMSTEEYEALSNVSMEFFDPSNLASGIANFFSDSVKRLGQISNFLLPSNTAAKEYEAALKDIKKIQVRVKDGKLLIKTRVFNTTIPRFLDISNLMVLIPYGTEITSIKTGILPYVGELITETSATSSELIKLLDAFYTKLAAINNSSDEGLRNYHDQSMMKPVSQLNKKYAEFKGSLRSDSHDYQTCQKAYANFSGLVKTNDLAHEIATSSITKNGKAIQSLISDIAEVSNTIIKRARQGKINLTQTVSKELSMEFSALSEAVSTLALAWYVGYEYSITHSKNIHMFQNKF